MIPLGVETRGESEFDILEEKKRFPDSRKVCVLKRKFAKISFLQIFVSIHRPSLDQGSVFSLLKCQIQIPRMFLPIERLFPEKIFPCGWLPIV